MTATETFNGLGVCPGFSFGKVQIVDRRRVSVPRYRLRTGRIDAELDRFERAVTASEKQLVELRDRASRSSMNEVETLLDAHGTILRDKALHDATRDLIKVEGINAEWALSKVVRKIRDVFDGLDEDYFRERRSDVDVVGDRLLRNLVGAETELLANLSPDCIVVAYDLSPADTVSLARYAVKGFVTETGGRTSHIAIFARSMNIPAVVGVHGIVERAGTGDRIVVDGAAGVVVLRPSAAAQTRFRAAERRRAKEEAALLADRHLPAETKDGVKVSLLGNIEVAEEIDAVIANGGEGIGLFRTEFLVIERRRMPNLAEHLTEYKNVVRAMNGKTVTIRTIDIGGDKFVRANDPNTRAPVGANPALGMRAIRYSLRDIPAFKSQLRAVLEASAEGSIRLLLPLITTVEEVRRAKELIEEVRQELRSEGVPYDPALPVGVMIETPAAVMMADVIAREVDFFSIGTNDLIQYSFAVDRRNDDVAYLYQPAAPGVVRLLKLVSDAARGAGIPVTVCGEMAADPFHVPLLLGLGIRSLSMSAHSIPLVKRLIRRASAADAATMIERVLKAATVQEVEVELARALESW
ncbi:MAG: phosphoenolpyruvate--protein phosphotransferase [Myxococcota bacterium]